MEQMAQARASFRPVQPRSQNNMLNSARDLPDDPSVKLPNPNSTATQNGLSSLPIDGNTDPFATRALSQALAADIPRAPALVNDMESWPEVGQSVGSSSKGTTQHRNDASESTEEQRRKDDESSTSLPILPKKSASLVIFTTPLSTFRTIHSNSFYTAYFHLPPATRAY